MVRVRELTPRHTIVVRCAPCDRTALIQPRDLLHLRDQDKRVLSLAYRCSCCRRRAWAIAVQIAGVDVDWNENVPDFGGNARPDERRLTTAARADFAAHGLGGVGRLRSGP